MRRLLAVLSLVVAGCEAPPPAPAAAPAAPAPAIAEQWLGDWRGPEGTWLRIERSDTRYIVTISNLDGPRRFEAVATDTGLRFERDGVDETLRATNGEGTGMKWLRDKQTCLAVKTGEGFCRE